MSRPSVVSRREFRGPPSTTFHRYLIAGLAVGTTVAAWLLGGGQGSGVSFLQRALPVVYVLLASLLLVGSGLGPSFDRVQRAARELVGDMEQLRARLDKAPLGTRAEFLDGLMRDAPDSMPVTARLLLIANNDGRRVTGDEVLRPILNGLGEAVDGLFFWRNISVVAGLFGTVLFFAIALSTDTSSLGGVAPHVRAALLCTLAGLYGSFAIGLVADTWGRYVSSLGDEALALVDGPLSKILTKSLPSDDVIDSEAQLWEHLRQGVSRLIDRIDGQQNRLAVAIEEHAVALQAVHDDLTTAPPVTLPAELSNLSEALATYSVKLASSADRLTNTTTLIATSIETLGIDVPKQVLAATDQLKATATATKSSVDAVGTSVTEAKSSISTLGTRIDESGAQANALKTSIEELSGSIGEIGKKVTETRRTTEQLSSRAAATDISITALRSEVSDAKSAIGGAQTDIGSLQTNVGAAQERISAAATTLEGAGLRVSLLVSTLATVPNTLTEVQAVANKTLTEMRQLVSLLGPRQAEEVSTRLHRDQPHVTSQQSMAAPDAGIAERIASTEPIERETPPDATAVPTTKNAEHWPDRDAVEEREVDLQAISPTRQEDGRRQPESNVAKVKEQPGFWTRNRSAIGIIRWFRGGDRIVTPVKGEPLDTVGVKKNARSLLSRIRSASRGWFRQGAK